MNAFSDTRPVPGAMRAEDGFSLAELMVVAGLLMFILSSAYLALNTVTTMSDRTMAREQAATESALGLERVVREVRQARRLTTEGYAFKTTETNHAVFYVDLDHTGAPERVTYYVSNGALYRTQAQSTKALPRDADYGAESTPQLVVHLDPDWTTVFTYYDDGSGDYTAFTAPAQVTTPGLTTAVKITIKSKAKIGAETMTGQATSLVNIRSTNIILNGS